MQVVIKDLDQTRIRYEAMVQQVGEGAAALAFSRALNHEGRKTFTAVKRTLRAHVAYTDDYRPGIPETDAA